MHRPGNIVPWALPPDAQHPSYRTTAYNPLDFVMGELIRERKPLSSLERSFGLGVRMDELPKAQTDF